jgi:hypothetical protein
MRGKTSPAPSNKLIIKVDSIAGNVKMNIRISIFI